MIHIEGMGWMGAALAYRLDAADIPFTWHDTDAPHVAWAASTGMVYPAGDSRSRAELDRWHSLAAVFPPGTVRRASYVYAHKNPPHAGTYRPRADLGWARVADAPCYAVDVPAIVAAARTAYAERRRPAPPAGQPLIVAHGHTDRRAGWVWGWSAPVRLELPAPLDDGAPVALYGRAHRFAITYAYPIPTRPGWWWAGSSLINQTHPRPLDAGAHFARWRSHAAALYPPVRLLDAEDPVHGWRPKPHPGDSGTLDITPPGRCVFPPLWHSGVRWAPSLLDGAATWAADHLTVGTRHEP